MAGDFRYETGKTAIPWPAVGEPYGGEDVVELVRFLLRPGEDEAAYGQAAEKAQRAIAGTSRVGCARRRKCRPSGCVCR